VLVISGPSGVRPSRAARALAPPSAARLSRFARLTLSPAAPQVGKDAVVQALQRRRPATHFVVTATTRAQRPGEAHGVDYLFVSREEFASMVTRGELLEHALVYGDYKGIPKAQVRDALAAGTDVVLRLDVQGAATMRRLLPSAVFVFLAAESEAALVARLVSRKTEPADKLLLRVATAREETRRLSEFDYSVVNAQGQLERAVDDLCAIIDAERLRVSRAPVEL
jgi:guanylate kinase